MLPSTGGSLRRSRSAFHAPAADPPRSRLTPAPIADGEAARSRPARTTGGRRLSPSGGACGEWHLQVRVLGDIARPASTSERCPATRAGAGREPSRTLANGRPENRVERLADDEHSDPSPVPAVLTRPPSPRRDTAADAGCDGHPRGGCSAPAHRPTTPYALIGAGELRPVHIGPSCRAAAGGTRPLRQRPDVVRTRPSRRSAAAQHGRERCTAPSTAGHALADLCSCRALSEVRARRWTRSNT